jgi:hypothetical protein
MLDLEVTRKRVKRGKEGGEEGVTLSRAREPGRPTCWGRTKGEHDWMALHKTQDTTTLRSPMHQFSLVDHDTENRSDRAYADLLCDALFIVSSEAFVCILMLIIPALLDHTYTHVCCKIKLFNLKQNIYEIA